MSRLLIALLQCVQSVAGLLEIGINLQRLLKVGSGVFDIASCLVRSAESELGTGRFWIIRRICSEQLDSAVEVTHLDHLVSDEFHAVMRFQNGIRSLEASIRPQHSYRIGPLHVELLKHLLQRCPLVLRRAEETRIQLFVHHDGLNRVRIQLSPSADLDFPDRVGEEDSIHRAVVSDSILRADRCSKGVNGRRAPVANDQKRLLVNEYIFFEPIVQGDVKLVDRIARECVRPGHFDSGPKRLVVHEGINDLRAVPGSRGGGPTVRRTTPGSA